MENKRMRESLRGNAMVEERNGGIIIEERGEEGQEEGMEGGRKGKKKGYKG